MTCANNDLHNNVKPMVGLLPVVLGATGANAGAIVDRQGYGGVEYTIAYGAITSTGTIVTAILKEGDVTGTLTSVADADMLGTETLASLAAGARVAGTGKEVVKRLGYIGGKRYVQLTLDGTGATSAGIVSATAILHCPRVAPISNP